MNTHDSITVELLPPGSVQLRVIDQRNHSKRADGKPPFIGSAVLAPCVTDPSTGILIALLLQREATESPGWRRRLMSDVIKVARSLGYRRLMADTDGRPRSGWHALDHGWIAIPIDEDPPHSSGEVTMTDERHDIPPAEPAKPSEPPAPAPADPERVDAVAYVVGVETLISGGLAGS